MAIVDSAFREWIAEFKDINPGFADTRQIIDTAQYAFAAGRAAQREIDAARQPGAQEPAVWVNPEHLASMLSASVSVHVHGLTQRDERHTQPLYPAPPAQGIDLGPVREFLRRRMAQWRSHLPSDPGAPGTVAISGDGEGGYNNDVRMYREGLALMDQVLALINNPRDAAPGVGNG